MSTRAWTGFLVAALAAGCAQGMEEDSGGGPDAGGHADAREFADAGPRPDAEVRPDAAPQPDAAPVPTACEKLDAPAAQLSSYPASFDGNVSGQTALLSVGTGSCAVEEAPYGVAAAGPEQVIELDNLTADTPYAVRVDADFDVAFYVVTGCSGGSGFSAGECLYYTDAEISGAEVGQFTGPAGGVAWVVVDYYGSSTPSTGTYTISVIENPECGTDWDCNGGAPICDPTTLTCAAGYDQCVGDDANDSADDGPGGATELTLVPDVPATVNASVCGAPDTEADWFRFTAAEGDQVNLTLTWSDGSELDAYVYDSGGNQIDYLWGYTSPELLQLTDLTAGDYFIKLIRYGDSSTTVTDYTLTAALPECTWSGDCDASKPVCTADQVCEPAETGCTGDAADADDGASVATVLTMPATVSSKICSAPLGNSLFEGDGYSLEEDWYRIDVAAGKTLTANLAWTETAASEDLDLYVLDSNGTTVDCSWFDNPETVSATATTAGTYYLVVHKYTPTDVPAPTPYTLDASITP